MYVPLSPPIALILNSQLTHLLTDAPGAKAEPPAARAPRAVAAQLHVHVRGRAPAADRQRVNLHAGARAGHAVVYAAQLALVRLMCVSDHDHNFSSPRHHPKTHRDRGRGGVGEAL